MYYYYKFVDTNKVPLLMREEAQRMALFAVRALNIEWPLAYKGLWITWFRKIGTGAEAANHPLAAFTWRDEVWGFVRPQNPNRIYVRCDLPTLDAVRVAVAHEVYHVAENMMGLQYDEASERKAESFAMFAFCNLYGRIPMLR